MKWATHAVRMAKIPGTTLADIAEKCGVSRERVRQVLEALGIKLTNKAGRRLAKDSIREQAEKLLEDGLTGHEIAAALGKSYGQVRHALYYRGRKR